MQSDLKHVYDWFMGIITYGEACSPVLLSARLPKRVKFDQAYRVLLQTLRAIGGAKRAFSGEQVYSHVSTHRDRDEMPVPLIHWSRYVRNTSKIVQTHDRDTYVEILGERRT